MAEIDIINFFLLLVLSVMEPHLFLKKSQLFSKEIQANSICFEINQGTNASKMTIAKVAVPELNQKKALTMNLSYFFIKKISFSANIQSHYLF
jgi:hypothetical protein